MAKISQATKNDVKDEKNCVYAPADFDDSTEIGCGEIDMSAYLSRVSRVIVVGISYACMLSLMGCQNYIFRSFDLDRGDSLSIDAKQRLVFVTQRGGKHGDRQIVCAEPSPDAISATAAAGSAAFAFPTLIPGAAGAAASQGGPAQGGLSVARSESAASIGLRTQAIQLLRDGLYRACEAYMNGAIDETQYTLLLLNIDRVMITLVGIDAIGGTPMAAPVVVHAGAPGVKTTMNKDGTVSTEVTGPAAGPGGTAYPVNARAAHLEAASSAAIAEIVLAANAGTSFPAVCVALLSSDRLNRDNPGHRSVMDSCHHLVGGAFAKILSQPPPRARPLGARQPVAKTSSKKDKDAPKAAPKEAQQEAPKKKAQAASPQQPASWNPAIYPQGSSY